MKLAVMQPYILPYLGYFQLIDAVDVFVLYDNIKYTKKGWINRNRYLQGGRDVMFTVPLKAASDFLDVRDRELAPGPGLQKVLNQLEAAYRRAPYFRDAFSVVEEVLKFKSSSLFEFLHNGIYAVCNFLEISTPIKVSSDVAIDHDLKGEQKVLAICAELGATRYINAIGGQELYSRDEFYRRGVELRFIKPKLAAYQQFEAPFVSGLSIVDVMMFNSVDEIRSRLLPNYELI